MANPINSLNAISEQFLHHDFLQMQRNAEMFHSNNANTHNIQRNQNQINNNIAREENPRHSDKNVNGSNANSKKDDKKNNVNKRDSRK